MDVGAWLRGLGLSQYERAFHDNDVDADLLAKLTAEDLKEIGVASVGHRRRLLEAIAILRADAVLPSTPPAEALEPAVGAERRQLTVMFVDLVGSTALAARLDPEEMQDLIRAYQDAVAGEIGRFEGHLAKFMGDGVLAYFGWPHTHEDEAERAVRAGRAAIEAVARLRAPDREPLAARVGIATGVVVVGDLVGTGEARERAVTGGTPNLAARLQALAPSGGVVIAEATRRLLGSLFEVEDLGPQAVKGLGAPVRAFRVGAERGGVGRFEARHAGSRLMPMVGRDQELALLVERWRLARAGEGQGVLLTGEPGIGKSRLLGALLEALVQEAHVAVRCQCSPYHSGSALWPAIQHLEHAARFEASDGDEERLAKLEALLRVDSDEAGRIVPLMASLLGIEAEGRYPPLDLTPQQRRAATLDVLARQLLALGGRAEPVLLVVEDVHWIDPTTLELVELLLSRVVASPVLVVLTARPEFQERLGAHAHLTRLGLTRLGRGDAAAIVGGIAGGRPLPDEVSVEIASRTDGVPLFLEELTKAVLESGLLRDHGDRYELAGPLPSLAIPSTLHDSLMARLDRLAPVKEVAQVAACIGREFPHGLLAAVAPLREAALLDALDRLSEAELVFRRGAPPDATYAFKHALVRDAAYQSLLKSRRQQIHTKIAQALEDRFPGTAAAQPEVLARHCIEAGLVEKAVAYWHQAGQLAIRRSAMAEAVAHLTTALGLLAGLADGPERRRQEFELQMTLGLALNAAKGWASAEMGRAYARARELGHTLDDTRQLLPVLVGLRTFHVNRAELNAALEVAGELLRLAQTHEDAAIILGHMAVGNVLMWMAKFDAALLHFEQVLTAYDPLKHSFPNYAPYDPRVFARSFAAWVLLFQGFPDKALPQAGQALAEAREISRPVNLAFALHVSCLFHQVRGDRAALEERSTALVRLAAEQGFPHFLGTGTFFRGWALAQGEEVEKGLEEMRRGLAAKRATGAEIKVPYYLGLTADLLPRAGGAGEALRLLADALAQVEATGERWFEAELHRLRGEALLRVTAADVAEAEACFGKALDVARGQDARWWELRAATSLARLWVRHGRRRQARDLLAPVYGWFTEGFDTPDLREARALLDALQ